MFVNRFPNFEKGRILKIEMLESLRDYPRNFIDIYFKDYSNGIITGAGLIIDDSYIKITRGIVKHKDKIYMLSNDFKIPYGFTNKEVIIKIKFLKEITENDFNISNTKIFIDENTNLEDDELELGRFKLREGAVLRSEYTDFNDFSTEYNTINIINTEYSGVKKSTLNPIILREFGSILLKNKTKNQYDISFAMASLNQKIIDKDLILYYISNRLNIEFKEYSNNQIYKYLCQIVREVQGKGEIRSEMRLNRISRILVD